MITEPLVPVDTIAQTNHSSPQTSQLIALRTRTELQPPFRTTEVLIVEIPSKSANTILKAANEAIQDHTGRSLYHLRRFVKPEHLPSYLKSPSDLAKVSESDTRRVCVIQKKDPNSNEDGTSRDERPLDERPLVQDQRPQSLYFLICMSSALSSHSAVKLVESWSPLFTGGLRPRTRKIYVPLFPPVSEEQAKVWSQKYWPTIYNKNFPFGAHPTTITRAENEMQERAREWMDLARSVAKESFKSSMGEPIGAAVVDRTSGQGPSLVIVAGDARWVDCIKIGDDRGSNVMAHAVMRAIGLVGKKRRDLQRQKTQKNSESPSDYFMDKPLTIQESKAYEENALTPDGYLCLGLELYITHEPCVMCSMAILHSRFDRIVFGERLPRTGGISAEMSKNVDTNTRNPDDGLGYGLFWRPELNWKLLAWQFIDYGYPSMKLSSLDTHA